MDALPPTPVVQAPANLNLTTDWETYTVSAPIDTASTNKGKGGFWMGMTIASSMGAVVAWVAGHMKG